ncbi:MAG: ferritin-like domain-containing protein [Actinomycetota bacterium]|nr:ferritin-like domain-containing protein [Actinomycetota bacterium]
MPQIAEVAGLRSQEPGPGAVEVVELLNGLLGAYWTAYAQHRTHRTVLADLGLDGLGATYEAHIADEPVTIAELTERILDLDGLPAPALGEVRVGSTVEELLELDMALQAQARSALNAAAETAAAHHDATTRNLIERVLADEEDHLAWLRTEVDLFRRLGAQLYTAARLTVTNAATPSG